MPVPKPTHFEKGVTPGKLRVVKEIKSDIDEDIFFARPWDICVSKTGFMYVFDLKLQKLFIFNEKFQYLGQFLEKGLGPGEIFPSYGSAIKCGIGPKQNIYLCNSRGDRLSLFTPLGKHIRDIKMNRIMHGFEPFPPVVDDNGFIYAYSVNGGIVDKYDQNMKLVHTYLDKKLNEQFLIYRPPFEEISKHSRFPIDIYFKAGGGTTAYDLTPDNQLVIYQYRTSTVYIFKDKKQVRHFDILLDKAINSYREKAKEISIKQKKRLARKNSSASTIFLPAMFDYFFVDKDAPYFYLSYIAEDGNGFLYKFDLYGKLVKRFSNLRKKYSVQTKRNGFFYGLSAPGWYPVILKEEVIQ